MKKVSSALSLPANYIAACSGGSKTSPTASHCSLRSSGISASMITLAGSMQQPTCQRQATSLQALLEGRILATGGGAAGRTVASLGLDTATVVHGKTSTVDETTAHLERRRRFEHSQPSTTAQQQLAALTLGTAEKSTITSTITTSSSNSSNQQPSATRHQHSSSVDGGNDSSNTRTGVPSSSSFIEYVG